MARTATPVTPDEVRAWARETNWTDSRGREVSDRGRMSSELIEAYNKRHRTRMYEETGRQTGTSRGTAVATRDNASATRRTRTASTRQAAQPQQVVSGEVMEPSAGTNIGNEAAMSLENVLAMFASMPAGSKRGGRPTLVTVTAQTLEYV